MSVHHNAHSNILRVKKGIQSKRERERERGREQAIECNQLFGI